VKNKIIINQSLIKYYQVEDDTFCDKFSIFVQILAKIITENLFLIYLKLKLTISCKLRSFPALPPGGHVVLASQSPYPITVYSVANYRPHLSHSDATPSSGSSPLYSPGLSHLLKLAALSRNQIKYVFKNLGVQKIIMLFFLVDHRLTENTKSKSNC